MRSGEKCVLTEKDLELERGLKALEIHDRLVALARLDRRVEAALCFYLLESMSGSSKSTTDTAAAVDYARECLGFEDRKTRTLLNLARRFEELPKMKESFGRGEIPKGGLRSKGHPPRSKSGDQSALGIHGRKRRNGGSDSSAKPKRFQSSTTRTFALSMTWANKTERASSSWSSSKERRSNIG